MAQGTVAIDITQLVHWPGKLTGIPRVIEELAKRFGKNTDFDAVFVSWVKDIGAFCVVDLEASLAQRGKGIVYVPKGKEGVSSHGSQSSRPSFVSRAQQVAKPYAHKAVNSLGRVSPRVANRLKNQAVGRMAANYQQWDPQQAYVLFIPHGEWWDDSYIDVVKRAALKGVRIVQLIHDMLPVVTPQYSGHATRSFTNYCTQVLPICNLILAISKSTETDIITWLKSQKLDVPKIAVFHEGEDFSFASAQKPTDEVFVGSGLKGKDYILCVGTVEARKNHTLLYYVVKLAKQKGVALPKIVVVGRRGWKTENFFDIAQDDPETKEQMIFLTDTSDNELSWLYDHCLFTIYPSFYEGWGLPIAESVSRGVPCICSNTSSMKEVAPDYVSFFSPASTDECLAAVQKMLDPKNLDKAKQKLKNYHGTTWNDAYNDIASIMKEQL